MNVDRGAVLCFTLPACKLLALRAVYSFVGKLVEARANPSGKSQPP